MNKIIINKFVTITPLKRLKTKRLLISLRSTRNDIMVCYWGGGKQQGALRPAAFLLPYPPKLKCHSERSEESLIIRQKIIWNNKHINPYRIFL